MTTYSNPGQIQIGPDTLEKLPDLLRTSGHKVLLVHGHRPVEDGLLTKVRVLLTKAGFPHANMGQILPNPKYSSVKRGIKIARKENCDIILALGGGSTLQCAKAIALGLEYKGDVWDFWEGKKQPQKAAVIGSILTNPASGAELSDGCTLVRKGKQKEIHNSLLSCRFAILDPKLSQYPLYPTMNQSFVLFLHLFTASIEKEGLMQKMAVMLLQELLSCSDELEKDVSNLEARTDLYWAGLLTHSLIGKIETGYKDLSDHVAFTLSLPDGSAASALFAAWAQSLDDQAKKKAALTGQTIFGMKSPDFDKTIDQFTSRIEKMGLPVSLPQTGLVLEEKDLEDLTSDKDDLALLKNAMKDPDKLKG